MFSLFKLISHITDVQYTVTTWYLQSCEVYPVVGDVSEFVEIVYLKFWVILHLYSGLNLTRERENLLSWLKSEHLLWTVVSVLDHRLTSG